jgi:ankyrin repeat protein
MVSLVLTLLIPLAAYQLDNALLLAADQGDMRQIQKLLKQGANVNARTDLSRSVAGSVPGLFDKACWTPLMAATRGGRAKAVGLFTAPM